MSQIPIQKIVFNKDTFNKVINTQFTQLIDQAEIETADQPSFSIDDFFSLYEQLFYQIPRDGDINSHQYILQKEADYLGITINQDDIQALLNEITSLRQQVLDTQTLVNQLSSTTTNIA
jgi:FKBP-type peptidyl-prolyl cis-trans isomerase (trigger factor)